MRRLFHPVAVVVIGSSFVLAGTPSPAFAVDSSFGNACLATTGPSGTTGVMTAKGAGNPLPIAAPANGVITKATLAIPAVSPATIVLKTMRPTAAPNAFTVAAESTAFLIQTGTAGYPVRVPVKTGDLLGMSGAGTLMCTTADAGDVVGLAAGNSAVGSTVTYAPTPNRALSMVATIEPDADGDEYGDTTQDLCPQSASFHSACPVARLDSFVSPSKGKLGVYVGVSTSTTVKVTGVAKVNGKKVKLKGGTKTAEPGKLTLFKVTLPKALKAALAKLPASKKITVTLTSSATNLAATVTTDTTKVKLPGTK
jgi:hypothetical protein